MLKENIYEDLLTLLQQHNELFAENGSLLKNKAQELALKNDPKLIKILLGSPKFKQMFFFEVSGAIIFDKDKLIELIYNKEFLPDSYTKYSQRIGLSSGGDFITKNKEVVLNWPYKDCTLEGGMTTEERGRNEIFWNEVIAPEQITRLREPKAFMNAKKITTKRSKKFTDFKRDETGTIKDNLIIKGNNLLALYSLKEQFAGKIKLIYIDPPYNTGGDGFKYNDRFKHSTWLTFMRNRLEVAIKLLAEDGIIFISIDDNEKAYLEVLCDEIFGRENFVATIPRKTRSGKSDVPYRLSQDFDFMLVYSKKGDKKQILFRRKIDRRYYKSDDFPNDEWRLNPLSTQRTTKERPNSDFTIINPKNGDAFHVNPNRCWAVTKDSFPKYYEKDKIVFPGDYDFLNIKKPMLRVFKSEDIKKKGEDYNKSFVSSDFLNEAMDHFLNKSKNAEGTKEILSEFESKVFSFPKPVSLIQKVVEISTNKDDIILDFFAGSGTTGHAVLKLNREDEGNRQFILVEQLQEHIDVCEERQQKAIKQEFPPESINYGKGDEIIYMELAEWNQRWIAEIKKTATKKQTSDLWQKLKENAFLSYKIDIKKVDDKIEDFEQLTLEDQKKFLLECLDVNRLYINYSDLEDIDYKLSKADKELSRKFYNR